jgi:hypothetical protein
MLARAAYCAEEAIPRAWTSALTMMATAIMVVDNRRAAEAVKVAACDDCSQP